jgi:hypothetical protein
MKQFPWLFDIIRVLPPSFVGAMNPGMRLLLDGQAVPILLSPGRSKN